MVSFTGHEGMLVACTVVGGRVRLHRLGSADVHTYVDALRFALGVQVRTGRVPVAAVRAADALDAKLFRPLSGVLRDRELVVIPAEGMSGLVWAAVPSCVGRPVSVAPSAGTWLRAWQVPAGQGTAWISGPGLAHADREVTELCREGKLLVRSTVDEAVTAMDGADLVHIAAHGKFREDAPMFSSLELADGQLYGYDLDRLHRAPRLLVLSACEIARGEAIATVILSRGGQAMIASTIPVPDEQAVHLVTALHAGLRAGRSPSAALAAAQLTHGHLGFTCLGAG